MTKHILLFLDLDSQVYEILELFSFVFHFQNFNLRSNLFISASIRVLQHEVDQRGHEVEDRQGFLHRNLPRGFRPLHGIVISHAFLSKRL
jgi:hypothetical protein